MTNTTNTFKKEMVKAQEMAGYRERYAMKHGKIKASYHNGERLYTFTYGAEHEYQDANGAMYNATRKCWVN